MNKSWPTLYKKTRTGKINQWRIWVEDTHIYIEWGQRGGSLQFASEIVGSGKNIGKRNETTSEQQAYLEAESKHNKQIKDGYVENLDDAEAGKEKREGVRPILAHEYTAHYSKLIFPCYVSPKIDGIRMLATIKDGVATLHSRNLEPINSVPHIKKSLECLYPKGIVVLDGELYNHSLTFEKITSIVRKQKTLSLEHTLLQYWIFDSVYTGSFEDRFINSDVIKRLSDNIPFLKLVPTILVDTEIELFAEFEKYKLQSYEGLMARNREGLYVGNRSYDLLKLKDFIDSEFEIIDVVEGKGKLSGCGVFVCKTVNGTVFQCKMSGPLASLSNYLNDKETYIGKFLTVKYQNLTSDSGVPRFPIGLRIKSEF